MAQSSPGFGYADWTVVVVYFLGITAFGLWVARKIRTSGGYFLGDRWQAVSAQIHHHLVIASCVAGAVIALYLA